jgi:phospholipase/carboxylesterase
MSLEYLVKAPKEVKEKNGALLLIHGYGSNEEDLFSFATQLPEDVYVISIRAPLNLQPYGYAWYEITFDADENKFSNNEQAKESLQLIANFIDEISEKLPLDKSNISLIGFSQGAILSYGMAFTYPEKINKVVALSGYLNEQILPENYDVNQINEIFDLSKGNFSEISSIKFAISCKDSLACSLFENLFSSASKVISYHA